MREPYRLLDLFSGIGGWSIGLERSGAFRTAAFCEVEEFPRKVLAKNWPEVPIYDDVRTLTADRLRADGVAVDAIAGGFPCQDTSLAGRGAGLAGERSGLWFEFARLIGELRPRLVFIENSPGLLRRGMPRVLGDLAALGYDAEWSVVSACSLGFTHTRERLFILAYPESERWEQRGRFELDARCEVSRDVHQRLSQPEPLRVADGIRHRTHRNRALGNSLVPHAAWLIGCAILAAEALDAANAPQPIREAAE